jgi:hypothetical protein
VQGERTAGYRGVGDGYLGSQVLTPHSWPDTPLRAEMPMPVGSDLRPRLRCLSPDFFGRRSRAELRHTQVPHSFPHSIPLSVYQSLSPPLHLDNVATYRHGDHDDLYPLTPLSEAYAHAAIFSIGLFAPARDPLPHLRAARKSKASPQAGKGRTSHTCSDDRCYDLTRCRLEGRHVHHGSRRYGGGSGQGEAGRGRGE